MRQTAEAFGKDWIRPENRLIFILVFICIAASAMLIAFLPAPYQVLGLIPGPALIIGLLGAEFPLIPISIIVFFLPMNSLVESESWSIVKVLAMISFAALTLRIGLSKGMFKFRDCHQFIPLSYFFLAAVISTIFTIDMGRSTWALKKYLTMFLLFFLIVNIVRTEKSFRFLMNLFLGATTFSCFYSAFTLLIGTNLVSQASRVHRYTMASGSERVWGLLGSSPNQWGGFVVCALGFMIVYFFGAKLFWKKLWYGLMIPLYTLTIISTYSRAAFIGMILMYGLAGWEMREFIPWKILGVLVIILALSWFVLPEDYRERMGGMASTDFAEEDSSIQRRIGYYYLAWEVFKERPFTGMGPKTFSHIYARPIYADYATLEESSVGGRNEHSSYLHLLVGEGALGLLLIFWFYTSIVIDIRRAKKFLESIGEKWSPTWQIVLGLELLYYSYIFLGLFMDMLFSKHFWFWMAMGAVALKITQEKFLATSKFRQIGQENRRIQ